LQGDHKCCVSWGFSKSIGVVHFEVFICMLLTVDCVFRWFNTYDCVMLTLDFCQIVPWQMFECFFWLFRRFCNNYFIFQMFWCKLGWNPNSNWVSRSLLLSCEKLPNPWRRFVNNKRWSCFSYGAANVSLFFLLVSYWGISYFFLSCVMQIQKLNKWQLEIDIKKIGLNTLLFGCSLLSVHSIMTNVRRGSQV